MKITLTFKCLALVLSATAAVDPASNDQPLRHLKEGKKGKKEQDDNKDGYEFTPAQPIEFFRDGIDPEVFEWVNKTEVVAGGITCGFLKANLGSLPNKKYPKVQVYVCVWFDEIQPAPKGNLFVHCGGPGSLSDCLYSRNDGIGVGYNFISIDQRGMGRSTPSFSHSECTMPLTDDGNQTSAFLVASKGFVGLEDFLELWKQRVVNCWTCESCGFKLNAEQEDGSMEEFHFLEFSGTRQLAEDMERFRKAIHANKLSLYGISYGTKVMATYATIFPESVGLFAIDSNVPSNNDLLQQATESAKNVAMRFDYILYSCGARRLLEQDPNACPVDDFGDCMRDAVEILGGFREVEEFANVLFVKPDRSLELCQLAKAGDQHGLQAAIDEIREEFSGGNRLRRQEVVSAYNPYSSQPSFNSGNIIYVVGIPNYASIMGDPNYIPQWLVYAQDYYGGGSCSYNEEIMVRKVTQINEEYDFLRSGNPAQQFLYWLVMGFYWPKGVPLPPLGNPSTTGIISGQVFDRSTPYEWTQEMRASFPSTKLLTSQSLSHGLNTIGWRPDGNNECFQHLIDYFETGSIGFNDGQICEAPFALNSDIPFEPLSPYFG